MAWINSLAVTHILEACSEKNLAVDAWWRDETALRDWWLRSGFDLFNSEVYVPVPSGAGLVVWIRALKAHDDGVVVWSVIAVASDEGLGVGTFKGLWGEDAKRLPEGYISQWTARNQLRIQNMPAKPGDRVACADYEKQGRIALCHSVDDAGRVVEVIFPGAEIARAKDVAKRWFKLEQRDEAFDFYWKHGRDTWGHYMAMSSALFHKQKAMVGKKNVVIGQKGSKLSKTVDPKLGIKVAAPEPVRAKEIAPVKASDYVAPVPAIPPEEYESRYQQGRNFYGQKIKRDYIRDAMQEQHWEALEAGWDAAMADDLI